MKIKTIIIKEIANIIRCFRDIQAYEKTKSLYPNDD